MSQLRAKVKNGRLIVDEPASLPEGTVLDLVLDDEGDDLDDEGRRALDAAIARAWESAKARRVPSGADVINEIRDRR
ncbi:MAG: hypothetical protein AB1486_14670 [Planctomycetota bacterium]